MTMSSDSGSMDVYSRSTCASVRYCAARTSYLQGAVCYVAAMTLVSRKVCLRAVGVHPGSVQHLVQRAMHAPQWITCHVDA